MIDDWKRETLGVVNEARWLWQLSSDHFKSTASEIIFESSPIPFVNLFAALTPSSRRLATQTRLHRPIVHFNPPRRTMTTPARLAAQAALASIDLSNYDPEQSRLMDERCILVDENDEAIGAMDKKTCE